MIGSEFGVGIYNEIGGFYFLSNVSGRLKFVTTANNINNGTYLIDTFTINTHHIFGTIMLAIYAPHLLAALLACLGRFAYNH